MKILSTIRKILLHVCVVCSLVSITAKILDWYNPYMDFSGHVGGLQMVLYFVVIVLAVTEGGSIISGRKIYHKSYVEYQGKISSPVFL